MTRDPRRVMSPKARAEALAAEAAAASARPVEGCAATDGESRCQLPAGHPGPWHRDRGVLFLEGSR